MSSVPTPFPLPEIPQDQRGHAVAAWSEPVELRTYETGTPSTLPAFLESRVYQGSSGRVYPLPFIESVSHEATVQTWQAVHLENEYLKLVILPELGGRVHVAVDKSTGRDFFYRNDVIKPALVGLAGNEHSEHVRLSMRVHAYDVRVDVSDSRRAASTRFRFGLQRFKTRHDRGRYGVHTTMGAAAPFRQA
ncbi:DUF5107 domain-containing protein [Leifsonia sp. WHRI 6310E]|uniref:DUF5107 domain-containing protein n=1 Tax=Leifsonia sp. WHRI 6310E TaxID=3162562 RepID=UPI0032EB593B